MIKPIFVVNRIMEEKKISRPLSREEDFSIISGYYQSGMSCIEYYIKNRNHQSEFKSHLANKWKIQRVLPPCASRSCPLDFFLILFPKYPGRRGHFNFGLFVFTYLHLTHALTSQFNLMCRVDDAVKYCISDSRFSDCIIPVGNR